MEQSKLKSRFLAYEQGGEKLISNTRLVIAIIYIVIVPVLSLVRFLTGDLPFPPRSNIGPTLFILYSVFLFIYVRRKQTFPRAFKYICASLDATLITTSIWIGLTYPEIAPPLPFLSLQAIFYFVLIIAGSFRFSVKCAYFSGIFSCLAYITLVLMNKNILDLPYYLELNSETIGLRFPFYNEFFRVIAILLSGLITGLACKRRYSMFNKIIDIENASAEASLKTIEQTRNLTVTISKSTEEILKSSKNIYATANNQAISIQEIEATINNNMQIAGDITEKTGSVANIATKMENDVNSGFVLLGRNIEQMEDIKKKNDSVISGIIELGNKILKIREFIVTINAITDQTKVIAFNAALEAASAGTYGKRFSIVSSEVNRLADDIVLLTKQIRKQLEEIQVFSSKLIISSEESAEKILQGNNLIKTLEEIFFDIRSGAEVTASQAQTITVSTERQQQSTGQVNVAITSISKGLSNFIHSTRVTTSLTEDLIEVMNELGELLNSDNSLSADNGAVTGFQGDRL
jgi:methyl-accepting chemotaxis protein